MSKQTEEIVSYLDSAGLRHSHTGYRYLIAAIQFQMEALHSCNKVMDVYEEVAVEFHTNRMNVERSIRYAIYPLRITNKEFILKAVDEICASTVSSGRN